jgi:hypothetical protein
MKKISRRDLFQTLLAFSPLALLTPICEEALLKFYRRAYKGEASEMKTYLMFNMFGAPARWMFDNCLMPNGDDNIIRHKTVFTNFVDDGKDHYDVVSTPVEYSTVPYGDYHVPKMWSSQLYFREQTVPMTNLLEHMFTIRGAKQGIDAHPSGNVRQACPRLGEVTVSGLVAGHSSRPFPALCFGVAPASTAFSSTNDKVVQLEVPYFNSSPENNPIHFLSRSFLGNDEAPTRQPSSADIHLPKNYDAVADYNRLKEKYTKIIKENRARCPIIGLTDKPLRAKEFAADSEEALRTELNRFMSDMGDFHLETDYSRLFANAEIGWDGFVEKQFALAEFVVLNKLSSSIVLNPPTSREYCVSHLKSENYFTGKDLKLKQEDGLWKVDLAKSKRTPGSTNINFDSHTLGSFFSNVVPALYWHSFSACLLEFVQTLKDYSTPEYNFFDNIVIHIASEFDRAIPTTDGKSLHHGNANPTSILSGMVKGYQIVGNVRVNSGFYGNDCTSGDAAPVKELGDEVLLTENVLSSITAILGGQELSYRHPSILWVDEGKIKTKLGKPKNVRV